MNDITALAKLRERERALEIEVHVVAGRLGEIRALIEQLEGNGRRRRGAAVATPSPELALQQQQAQAVAALQPQEDAA